MMRKIWMLLYTLTFCLILISCIKDLKELNAVETLEYKPSFSIPIGPLSYTLEEIMPPDSLLGYEIPDLDLIPDTSILIYNDIQYFYNPEEGFSTSYREPLNLSALSEQSGNVQSLMLKTNISNNLPVAIEIQGNLLNDQGVVIRSLSEENTIRIGSARLNSRGIITEPAKQSIYTHFYLEEVDELMTVTELELNLFLQTYSEGVDTLRVYSWYGIDLQFALRADLLIPITP